MKYTYKSSFYIEYAKKVQFFSGNNSVTNSHNFFYMQRLQKKNLTNIGQCPYCFVFFVCNNRLMHFCMCFNWKILNINNTFPSFSVPNLLFLDKLWKEGAILFFFFFCFVLFERSLSYLMVRFLPGNERQGWGALSFSWSNTTMFPYLLRWVNRETVYQPQRDSI